MDTITVMPMETMSINKDISMKGRSIIIMMKKNISMIMVINMMMVISMINMMMVINIPMKGTSIQSRESKVKLKLRNTKILI